MRTGDIIGVDLQFGFCQKLAVVAQQKRLRDLISIRFLRPGLNQNLALEIGGNIRTIIGRIMNANLADARFPSE